MGLRESYLALMRLSPLLRVASPTPVQHATQPVIHATPCATNAQRARGLQGEVGATLAAPDLQQSLSSDATSEKRALKLEALDLAAVAWTDADITAYLDRRARLMRWGRSEAEAEELAERLTKCAREHDERVSCVDCRHYRPGSCGNHRRAGLNLPQVGFDLASVPQRCPGFGPLKGGA